MSRKWRNWYQNEVDEEIKGVNSRDMVKHNERSDQLFLERKMTSFCSRALTGNPQLSNIQPLLPPHNHEKKFSLVLCRKLSMSVFDVRHDKSRHNVTAAGRVGTLAPNFSA